MNGRSLVVSLHDVTPFHFERLRKAELVFRELGVAKATYLLVPEFHGGYPSAADADFIAWCRAPRPFQVQWFLHGFHHLEAAAPTAAAGKLSDAWKRRVLTGGEGEFLALAPDAQRRKLEAGRAAFRTCLGVDPGGFVAPAWLFNAALFPLLREMGMRFSEDHRRIYRVDTGAGVDAPVITWATRTLARKYGSLAVCPLLGALWARRPALRVAVHPFDFDHSVTVTSIRRVLGAAMSGRDQRFCGDLPEWAPTSGESGTSFRP